jgi:hypothetical protein
MKKALIFTMVLFALSLIHLTGLNSALAATKYDSGSFWANHFGMKLAKIKTPEDILTNLNFSPKDLSEIRGNIANNKISIPAVTYKVYMSQIFIIKDKRNKTIIDFEKFKQKKLVLNGKAISLNPNKTIEDYKVEVAKILQPGKKVSLLDFVFNSAEAQSDDSGFFGYIASIFGASSDARNSRANDLKGTSTSETVTDNLIASYTYEERLAKKNAYVSKGSTNLTTLIFYCENNNLASVQEATVVRDGRPYGAKKEGRKLTPIPGGGYKFIYGNYPVKYSKSCQVKIDDRGVVVEIAEDSESPERCPKINLNIFNDPIYFGGFPKEASTCCRTQGCYEAVTAKRDQMIRSLTGQGEPTVKPEDSQTDSSESVE